MFENRCGAHVLEIKFAFVGYHCFCFAVEELAVKFCTVAKNYENVGSFAKVVVEHVEV